MYLLIGYLPWNIYKYNHIPLRQNLRVSISNYAIYTRPGDYYTRWRLVELVDPFLHTPCHKKMRKKKNSILEFAISFCLLPCGKGERNSLVRIWNSNSPLFLLPPSSEKITIRLLKSTQSLSLSLFCDHETGSTVILANLYRWESFSVQIKRPTMSGVWCEEAEFKVRMSGGKSCA